MPACVVDSTILLPGVLRAESLQRKLLVLFAYARLAHFSQAGMALPASVPPQSRFGGPSARELRNADADRASRLAERLPRDAPRTCLLASAWTLLDDFERALVAARVGADFGDADDPKRFRIAAASICVTVEQLPSPPPQYTEFPVLDQLLTTADQSQHRIVVTNDQRLARHQDMDDTFFEGERQVRIMRLERFVALHVDDPPFYVEDVDGDLLHEAFAYARPALR